MSLRRIIITGASGFVGRRLLDAFKEDFKIYGLARRSQARCEAPVHPNISWFQTDIADRRSIEAVFNQIAAAGRRRDRDPSGRPLRLHRRGAP